jgi:hypothetical protein
MAVGVEVVEPHGALEDVAHQAALRGAGPSGS